jgi:sterol desaturase/sphingolipid hydroxylase (fatty acid hydroxylase superfamily)
MVRVYRSKSHAGTVVPRSTCTNGDRHMQIHAYVLSRLMTCASVGLVAGLCLLMLAWLTNFLLASCLHCESQTIWPQLQSWYSSVPDSIRPWIWVMLKEWPSIFIKPFLEPYLYVVVAVIVMLEQLLPVERERKVLSASTIQDIFWFAMHRFLEVVLISLMMHVLRWVYDSYLSFLSIHTAESWPLVLKVTFVILVSDFLDWFHHLLRHKVWLFWCFHSVHHSQRHMNMFTDDRVHPVDEMVANCLIFVPMFMFSIGVPVALYLALALKWFPKLHHANVKTNLGWLRYVLVTPQSHRIHHSIEERHRDQNFGVIFSVWDRLFGTLYPHYDEYPSTGVEDLGFSLEREVGVLAVTRNYISQMLYPFCMIQRRFRAQGIDTGPLV